MVQTVAGNRRTGVIHVGEGPPARRLRFVSGALVAISGGGDADFIRAVTWSGVAEPDAVQQVVAGLDTSSDAVQVATVLRDRNVVAGDALLDAIDCWIEEEFAVITGWPMPPLDFLADEPADPWAAFQEQLGVSIAPGGLLLEGLRRQDELTSIAALIPDRWDVLIRDRAVGVPDDLLVDAGLLLDDLGDARPARDLLDHPRLSPFRALRAVVALRRLGLLRVASPAEIVVRADAAFTKGDEINAYGLYQRALHLGQEAARIHLHVAELAERAGRTDEAASHFIKSAPGLGDHAGQVVALRNALRLGAEPEPILLQLVGIYRALKEKDDLLAALLELARIHEAKGNLDLAVQEIGEAQDLGADAVACSLTLARLAERNGDQAEAAIQFELAARSARDAGREEDAIAAWTALLRTDPGLGEPARALASLYAKRGQKAEALRTLRVTLSAVVDPTAVQLVPLYELLTKLDPNDAAALDWLAKAYSRQKNRDGAVQQLRLAAAAQERGGDQAGVVRSFERIVELDPGSVEALLKLAELRLQLGQDGTAAIRWCQAVDLLIAAGDLPRARQVAETALQKVPASLHLRIRLAQVAVRVGDRAAAATSYRAAANLATGMGDTEAARDLMIQVCRLRPDDLVTRIRLAGLLEGGDPQIQEVILKDVVRCAMRSGNHGIALEHARRRVAIAPGLAYDQRSELVGLLNRIGDEAAELSEGRKLLDDLLSRGEIERVQDLLSRLVASQPQNAGLVLQLAELHEALGDHRRAARFFRHAVPLLQIDDRPDEAREALGKVCAMARNPDEPILVLARARLEKGAVIDWDKLRQEVEHRERLRKAESMGTIAIERRGSSSGTTSRIRQAR